MSTEVHECFKLTQEENEAFVKALRIINEPLAKLQSSDPEFKKVYDAYLISFNALVRHVQTASQATPQVKDPYFETRCRCVIIVNDNTAGTYCPVHGDQRTTRDQR